MAKVTFDVSITNDLEIGFFARGDSLDPEQAKAALEKLIKLLGESNITLEGVGAIERHDDQARLERVHDLTHHSH